MPLYKERSLRPWADELGKVALLVPGRSLPRLPPFLETVQLLPGRASDGCWHVLNSIKAAFDTVLELEGAANEVAEAFRDLLHTSNLGSWKVA